MGCYPAQGAGDFESSTEVIPMSCQCDTMFSYVVYVAPPCEFVHTSPEHRLLSAMPRQPPASGFQDLTIDIVSGGSRNL